MAAKGSKTTGNKYRYVGDHAITFELEDGTCPQVGPGDYITLSQIDWDALGEEGQSRFVDANSIPDAEPVVETPAQAEPIVETTS